MSSSGYFYYTLFLRDTSKPRTLMPGPGGSWSPMDLTAWLLSHTFGRTLSHFFYSYLLLLPQVSPWSTLAPCPSWGCWWRNLCWRAGLGWYRSGGSNFYYFFYFYFRREARGTR